MKLSWLAYVLGMVMLQACSDTSDSPVPVPGAKVYSLANQCAAIAVAGDGRFLASTGSGDAYRLVQGDPAQGGSFRLRPTDLGRYLLFDQDAHYLVSDGASLLRTEKLQSDQRVVDGVVTVEDRPVSEGEWELQVAARGFLLYHLQSGAYLRDDATMGPLSEAVPVRFVEARDCAEFPELSLDASGSVSVTTFDDGDVFGFVETHSHLFGNLGFGGGGVFHGAPFHPLGVEHALPDCELSHGVDGRGDFMGFFARGVEQFEDVVTVIGAGQLPGKDHDTAGYPDFTSWPNAPRRETHQSQYYRWVERAYLAGMRLLVQHATTNQVLCQLVTKLGSPQRYDCNDMLSVDRTIEATYAMERYIDALSGGPGEGWFRVVVSPAQAREVIETGKLAVVLGIETSDLFNCFLVPYGDFRKCSRADVVTRLDAYHARGVRAIFPVHKYDNAFSPGDGERLISDAGNFAHTGHYSSFVPCAPEYPPVPPVFDGGPVGFAALNQPREDYESPPPVNMSGFEADPIGTLAPYFTLFGGGELPGDYCQLHGLTDLGRFLIDELMARGMIIEVDHLPRRSYQEAFDILDDHDYPAVGSHGRNNLGRIYELGGVSMSDFALCRSPGEAATMDDPFEQRFEMMRELGAYVSEGFGFDMNGFHPAPGPRFGANSVCSEPQGDEGVSYPFTSYAGDIRFEPPRLGHRQVNYNTEGMVHLGLVAELIEDVRRDGASDADLEPLFRSAEGYLRMWEKAVRRAAERGR